MQNVTYILTQNNPRFIVLYLTENFQNKGDCVYTPNQSAFLEISFSSVSIECILILQSFAFKMQNR
jgi:hypothetical protein